MWNEWTSLPANLILALENEDVGDPAERNAQVNDLGFRDVIWDVADMHDARRFGRASRLQFHLLTSFQLKS